MKKMIKRDSALLYHQRILGIMVVYISYKTTDWYKELSLCEIGYQIYSKIEKSTKAYCENKNSLNGFNFLTNKQHLFSAYFNRGSSWSIRFFDGV